MRVLRDDESRDEDSFDLSEGNYHEFDIEINTMPNSLYSQLLASVFYNRDLPKEAFGPHMIRNSFVRLTVAKSNGYFLLGVHPIPQISDKTREYYELWKQPN